MLRSDRGVTEQRYTNPRTGDILSAFEALIQRASFASWVARFEIRPADFREVDQQRPPVVPRSLPRRVIGVTILVDVLLEQSIQPLVGNCVC